MTDVSQVTLDEVDVMDQRWHADGPPHALFARLRDECPVHRGVTDDGQRYWSVTRESEVTAVSRDPETFSNHRAGIFLHPDQVASLDLVRNVLLYKDPPEHTKYRKILAKVFTPKAVNALEPSIRARVTRVLDEIVEAGRADFVRDVAAPLPLGVLAEIMGLPEDDIPTLLEWTRQIERAQQSSEPRAAEGTFGEMFEYLQNLVGSQLGEDGAGEDTLVARLQQAEVDGESLSPDEILTFFALLVFAGNDTTRNTAGLGAAALLAHPDQWEHLREHPDRVPHAVEEILRYTSVVKFFARTATTDTELAGTAIAEGDKVVTWFTSASRDADLAGEDPQDFDVTRENPEHRAFGGGGPHLCLGNRLARLELRVLFEELLRRLPDLAADGEATVLASNWAHALESLPVRFTPGAREGS